MARKARLALGTICAYLSHPTGHSRLFESQKEPRSKFLNNIEIKKGKQRQIELNNPVWRCVKAFYFVIA